MSAVPTHQELVDLDIDARLLEVWCDIWADVQSGKLPEALLPLVAKHIRAAYGRGYCACIDEDEWTHGSLLHAHGYSVPRRRSSIP